jgi:hypothetical protein
MELKKGDLVVTLDKVENIKAIIGELKGGEIGVITETGPEFDTISVYGVVINEKMYYLFADEIEKLEEQC